MKPPADPPRPDSALPAAAADDEPEAFAARSMKLMAAGLMVGEAMLRSRVATSEVELAVRRLNKAFGYPQMEVSVTVNEIHLGLMDRRLRAPMSAIKVVDIGEVRLDLLVRFESLIAEVEAGERDLDGTVEELERIAGSPEPRPQWLNSLFALVSVAAWVIFAGGGVVGALAGVAAALVMQLVVVPLSHGRLPEVFATAASGALAVAGPAAAAWLGFPIAMTPAIVGGLYPLLPGGALVASITDGLSGTPLSAMAKGLEAAVTAVALALGALGALVLADDLGIVDTATAPHTANWVVAIAGGIAVLAIALSRSAPYRLAMIAGLVGLAAWVANWAMPTTPDGFPLSTFVAALVIGAGGQLVARAMRTSAAVFTTTAVFVVVPGLTTYLAMVAFAQGDSELGIDLAIRATAIAIAIAAGITLGVALTRRIPLPRRRVRGWSSVANRRLTSSSRRSSR